MGNSEDAFARLATRTQRLRRTLQPHWSASYQTVRELLANAETRITNSDDRPPDQQYRAVVKQYDRYRDRIPLRLPLEALREADGPSVGPYCRVFEAAIGIGLVVDCLEDVTPSFPEDHVPENIGLPADVLPESPEDAAVSLVDHSEPVLRFALTVDIVEEKLGLLSERSFARPRDQHLFESRLADALEDVDLRAALSIEEAIDEALVQKWKRDHFQSIDWERFEDLTATLLTELGLDANVTRRSLDYGIDVVVDRPDMRLLVQAKHYPSGSVGAPTVRRTAGLLLEFEADGVVVVTSGSITDPGRSVANRISENQRLDTDAPLILLLDGENFLELLDTADIVPPLDEVLPPDSLQEHVSTERL